MAYNTADMEAVKMQCENGYTKHGVKDTLSHGGAP